MNASPSNHPGAVRPILTIAWREWRTMFLSPLAWTLLAVLFALSAYMFVANIDQFTERQQFRAMGGSNRLSITDWVVAPMFGNAAVLLLLILPMLTMRLVAEEKRRLTWPVLASSPLNPMQIILGKYLGLLMFLLNTVILLAVPPLALSFFATMDYGQVVSGLLGLFLVAATFGAIGLAASSATDNPIVAAISTFGVLLLLWIAAWMGQSNGGPVEQTLNYLSLIGHYESFLKGVVSSDDLVYFILLSAFGLLFARQRLAAELFH